MKKLLLFYLVFTFCLVSNECSSSIDWKHRGVIFQLTIWKCGVESSYARAIKTTTNDDEKARINLNYLQLKSELDAILNQFEYDMNHKNCLVNKFDQINKTFKKGLTSENYTNSVIKNFAQEIDVYISDCKLFIKNPSYAQSDIPNMVSLFAVSPPDPMAVLGFVLTAYTEYKVIQGTKIAILTTLLNSIRLSSPGDKSTNK